MIDWIIMGIVFAIILCFGMYIFRMNSLNKVPFEEKKSYWSWITDVISHIHH